MDMEKDISKNTEENDNIKDNDGNLNNNSNNNNSCKKERRDYRMIFLYEYKLGRRPSETCRSVNEAFGQGTTSLRTVQHWFKKFRQGNENLEDSERCGRTPRVDHDQLRQAIHGCPNKSIRQIAKEIGVARSTVSTHLAILRKQRLMKKNSTDKLGDHNNNEKQQKLAKNRKRKQKLNKKKKKETVTKTKIKVEASKLDLNPLPLPIASVVLPTHQSQLHQHSHQIHEHPPPNATQLSSGPQHQSHDQICLVVNQHPHESLSTQHHYNGLQQQANIVGSADITATQIENFRSFQKFPFTYQN